MAAPSIYGLMAEFDSAEELLAAARQAHAAGFRRMDAYSPFPVEGLAEAIGFHDPWVARLVLLAGLFGAGFGFFSQYWVTVLDYPLNVGGRPLNSWPAYIPITFELTVLFAALTAVVGMIALNRLPMPYHPVFNVPAFRRVTEDGFFLCIEATDPLFDGGETKRFLETLHPREVSEVEY
ncbi:MAG: DUF3341 domain-containing protein [Candidatus Methylomirabilales bacterium]